MYNDSLPTVFAKVMTNDISADSINPEYLNQVDENNKTILDYALEKKHFILAGELIDRGSLANNQPAGFTALHYIAQYEQAHLLDKLKSKRALSPDEINAKSGLWVTPLMFAAEADNPALLVTLLALKADRKLKNMCGKTALLCAIAEDQVENVKILFDPATRYVDFLTDEFINDNILHYVARCNAYKTAEWLFQKLESNSPLWKEKNLSNLTPYELAIECNNFKVAMAFADLQRDQVPTLLYLSLARLIAAAPQVDEEANQSTLNENNDTVIYFQQTSDLVYKHEKFKKFLKKHRIHDYIGQTMTESEREKFNEFHLMLDF